MPDQPRTTGAIFLSYAREDGEAARGEADRAFEWLDKAIQYRDPGVGLTGTQWTFEKIHNDPRWLPFLRRTGRAPEQVVAVKFEVKLPER